MNGHSSAYSHVQQDVKSFIACMFKSVCRRHNRAKFAADIGRNGDAHVWIAGFEWLRSAYPKGA